MELSCERSASLPFVQANEWVTFSPSGTAPTAREYPGGVWDAANNRMYIFGGWDGPILSVILVGGLEHLDYFPIYWE